MLFKEQMMMGPRVWCNASTIAATRQMPIECDDRPVRIDFIISPSGSSNKSCSIWMFPVSYITPSAIFRRVGMLYPCCGTIALL